MKNNWVYIIVFMLLISCGEELIPKPQNLIPKDKMADIIQEMVVVNAAKSTNSTVLAENNIDPTEFVFKKYGIDSLQFVESDRYYVSLPNEYEEIYKVVEERLAAKTKEMSSAKRAKDSLLLLEKTKKAIERDSIAAVKKGSLP